MAALLVAVLIGITHSASATPIQFTFAGTISSFQASRNVFIDGQLVRVPLPDLAVPGDHFTGTAFFDPAADPFDRLGVGFLIKVNGNRWGGSDSINFGPSFLNSTEIFIALADGTADVPYTFGFGTLSASLISGTGSFEMGGISSNSTVSFVTGDITSFRALPDSGTSVTVFGIGLIGLMVLRRRLVQT